MRRPSEWTQVLLSVSTDCPVCPSLFPGIAPSAETMLQAHILSNPDAARYCVEPNYQQLPCNRLLNVYSPSLTPTMVSSDKH